MIVYRFTHIRYKDDISGTGAKLHGGRWNEPGIAALYTSSTISLSLLEVLVNAHTLKELQSLTLMKIQIPPSIEGSIQKLSSLKKDWLDDFDYSRWIGSRFLKEGDNLLLECPSAVITEEMNYLINPEHKDFKKVKLLSSDEFRFDERLFKVNNF
jgi:RES domain-containing protein